MYFSWNKLRHGFDQHLDETASQVENYSAEIPLTGLLQPPQTEHSRELAIHSPVACIWTVSKQTKKKTAHPWKKNQKRLGEFTFSHFFRASTVSKRNRDFLPFAIQNRVGDYEKAK